MVELCTKKSPFFYDGRKSLAGPGNTVTVSFVLIYSEVLVHQLIVIHRFWPNMDLNSKFRQLRPFNISRHILECREYVHLFFVSSPPDFSRIRHYPET
jgi:hypothetical protein